MIDFDDVTITQAVREQLAGTPDERLREIMQAAVRHLHAFVREVGLTRAEWLAGIEFLTAVGKTCTPEHQEFILLSDTLGLTTLVNLLEDRRGDADGTRASVLGPFYRSQSPQMALGDSVAQIHSGPEVVVYGRILDADDRPIASAHVDVWLADSNGQYDVQAHGPGVDDLRARFTTDSQGRYWFRSTVPLGYSIPMGGPVGALVRATARAGMRPAHLHFLIDAAGFRPLVTSLYFKADPYLETDAAFGVTRKLVIEVLPPAADSPLPALRRVPYDFHLTRETAVVDD